MRTAFGALIDYAGLFPPAQLSLAEAWAEYKQARRGAQSWMLGRFIISSSRLLASHERLDAALSIILDSAGDSLAELRERQTGASAIETIEVRIPRQNSQSGDLVSAIRQLRRDVDAAGLAGVAIYAELPRTRTDRALLASAMRSLAECGLGAKIRCGGLTADDFPSVIEVADFIIAANDSGVAFKATAGLHHPVRHVDTSTGFMMHGFLNLLAASAFAPRASNETLQRIVAEEDPSAFVFEDEALMWRGERATLDELETMRRARFIAYGSCSFSEPVEDLTALGILPAR